MSVVCYNRGNLGQREDNIMVHRREMPNRVRCGLKVRSHLQAGFGFGFALNSGFKVQHRMTLPEEQADDPTPNEQAVYDDLPDWDV